MKSSRVMSTEDLDQLQVEPHVNAALLTDIRDSKWKQFFKYKPSLWLTKKYVLLSQGSHILILKNWKNVIV